MRARQDHASRSHHEGGYVLLIVMMFVILSSTMLAAGYDRMHRVFAVEEASDRLPSTSDGIQEALGAGLARLQTGEPAVDAFNEYSCDLKMRDSNGAPVRYLLTYTKLANNQWTLHAEPAGVAGTECPATFTTNACPAAL